MMRQLDLSVNVHFLESVQSLQHLLKEFQEARDCQVTLDIAPGSGWRSLIYTSLYRRGAGVSEIGTTWVSGFANLHALRPFTPQEIADLGGEASFFPSLWQANQSGDGRVYTIPFLADTRMIYYWRDMFAQAGVAEAGAFSNHQRVEDTLNGLTRVILTPWATQTIESTHDLIYSSVSWVWGAGGDFLTPDGRRTAFNEPAARAGLRAYFDLNSFMPQQHQPFASQEITELFSERRVAAVVSGPWLMNYLAHELPMEELEVQVGVAFPPGPPFVGGMHLGIWDHTPDPEAALDLLKFLVSPDVQRVLCPLGGQLPSRLSVAEDHTYASSLPHYTTFLKGVQTGRNPAHQPLWGLVEEKLGLAYGEIWSELFESPEADVDEILDGVLTPLAAQMDRLLEK